MHTSGQLRCGGRFGGGADAAKVRTAARRPTGGAEDDAEDDEIAELGVAAVPLATRVPAPRTGPRSAARPPRRHQPSVRKRRACDTGEAQLEHGPVLQPHPALGGLTGKPGVERGRDAETQLSIAVPVLGWRAVMMCDVGHILVNHVMWLLIPRIVDARVFLPRIEDEHAADETIGIRHVGWGLGAVVDFLMVAVARAGPVPVVLATRQ